jgi:hypothetical protein
MCARAGRAVFGDLGPEGSQLGTKQQRSQLSAFLSVKIDDAVVVVHSWESARVLAPNSCSRFHDQDLARARSALRRSRYRW